MCSVKNMGDGKKSLPDLENCVAVRKMGNPEENKSLFCVISLANFRLFFNLVAVKMFNSESIR